MNTQATGEIRPKSINYFFCGIRKEWFIQQSPNFRTKAEAEAFAAQRGNLEIIEAIHRYTHDVELEELFTRQRLFSLAEINALTRRKSALLAGGAR